MTRVRFLGTLVVACAAIIALASDAGMAAPIPKERRRDDPANLKAFFAAIGKVVQDGKWPSAADEKKLLDSPRVVCEIMLRAAKQKERPLPVDVEKLVRKDIVREYKETGLNNGFVITENLRVTGARDSVIIASGDVQITSARNCVIVGQNVRITSVDDCVIVAGEYIRLTGANRRNGSAGSVLVAGHWIRTTVMDGTICHVLEPTGQPAPDGIQRPGTPPVPAISTNQAKDVIYLNDRTDTQGSNADQQTYIPQKTPVAK